MTPAFWGVRKVFFFLGCCVRMTVMRASPRQRATAHSHPRGKNRSVGFQPRARVLDLGNAGGDRASPSPTRPPDPFAMTRDLSHHRASATAGPEPRDHTAGRSTISPIYLLRADSANSVLLFITCLPPRASIRSDKCLTKRAVSSLES